MIFIRAGQSNVKYFKFRLCKFGFTKVEVVIVCRAYLGDKQGPIYESKIILIICVRIREKLHP